MRKLQHATKEIKTLLNGAARQLQRITRDEAIMAETPVEAQAAIESAADGIASALRQLEAITRENAQCPVIPGGPTRQQGQFLAFIREYTMRNQAGIAPSQADFQRFFNLTAPSVNSMLIRLEQRRFIRRVPGKARAIELVINPGALPPLDRPFKF